MKQLTLNQYAYIIPGSIALALGLIYLLDRARGDEANVAYVVLYSLLGGVLSLIGGVILLSRQSWATKLAKVAAPFAAGALLSTVFLDLLPEGLEAGETHDVLLATLVGVVAFFFIERFFHWFHHNHRADGSDPVKWFAITGDTVHNALDGVAIAAAFLISVPTGIVTTIAVAAHEIPHEVSDFGLLLQRGMSRMKVILVNIASALVTTLAAVGVFLLGGDDRIPVGVLTGLSAGLLLYIAMSDLIPEVHENAPRKRLFHWQPLVLLLGAVVVGLAINLAHGFTGHEHETTQPAAAEHHDHEH